jgi:hypothetical protein
MALLGSGIFVGSWIIFLGPEPWCVVSIIATEELPTVAANLQATK